MKTSETSIVEDAIEKLSYPSFFDRNERRAAYKLVLLWGSEDERLSAEAAKKKYPFDEQEENLFPTPDNYDFPIANRTRHVRFGE